MKRSIIALAAAAAVLLAVPANARAATASPNAAMEQLAYLAGNWNCAWTAGKYAGKVDLEFVSVLGGAWLQETELVPAANGQPRARSMHFTGYDPVAKRWNHVGPNADGTFDVATSADASAWDTVLPSPGEGLTLAKVSDTEFTETATAKSPDGPLTWVQRCKKAVSAGN
jgi:hypothetical protein